MKDFNKLAQAVYDKVYEKKGYATSWGGAGAAISEEPNTTWANDTRIVYCCTPDAKAYIWLLEELKSCVDVDYLTKYAYYPDLITTVAAVDKLDIPLREKLLQVLNHVKANEDKPHD